MNHPLPVICDRCRAQGAAGEDGFAELADLLNFEPVPRRIERVDGWSPECQRGFIAALAATGSKRRAAAAVGKDAEGAARLRKEPGAASFAAAWDRAVAVFRETGTSRLAASVGGVSARAGAWAHRPATLPAPPPDPRFANVPSAMLTELEVTAEIIRKYMLKLEAERRCRLKGRIAEADFYLRQVTCLEVALDVVTGNGMALLRDLRLGGFDLLHIAETDTSRQLDAARRAHWEKCGDPPRPEHPPRHLLVQHDGFATEPLVIAPGDTRSHNEQRRQFEAQHAQDAAAHIEWEAMARRDYEHRRDSDP